MSVGFSRSGAYGRGFLAGPDKGTTLDVRSEILIGPDPFLNLHGVKTGESTAWVMSVPV